MNPPQPEPGLPRHRYHHLVHLYLDPRHHHRVHIHLCHHHTHPLAPASPAHLHHHAPPAPVFIPDAYRVAHRQLEPPDGAVGEAAEDLDAEPELYTEEQAEEDEEAVFVLTDEWAEFLAKSDAKRRLAKQQKKNKGRK